MDLFEITNPELNLNDKLFFGKYKNTGMSLRDIIKTDVGYIDWCVTEKNIRLNKEAYELYLEFLRYEENKQRELQDDVDVIGDMFDR